MPEQHISRPEQFAPAWRPCPEIAERRVWTVLAIVLEKNQLRAWLSAEAVQVFVIPILRLRLNVYLAVLPFSEPLAGFFCFLKVEVFSSQIASF